MFLTDEEKRMLDGSSGEVVRIAMELMVKYGEALGAENLLPVNSVFCGTVGCSGSRFAQRLLKELDGSYDALFAKLMLCSDTKEKMPPAKCFQCSLTSSLDTSDSEIWKKLNVEEADYRFAADNEEFSKRIGMHVTYSCTPYHSGIMPVFGEHIVSMESSAISMFNAVVGARTNCEGMESAAATLFTGRTPNWGLHLDECRKGTHLIEIGDAALNDVMDWGLLGFFFGDKVGEKIPVISGVTKRPTLNMLKHSCAASASSGGVEMFHVVGVTPEAPDLETAFGKNSPQETFVYTAEDRRACYEFLNRSKEEEVDFIALGCPHYNLDQLWELCRLLDGRHVAKGVNLWISVPYSVKMLARRQGYEKAILDAGGLLVSDVCPSLSGICPAGARSAATDSAKMAKYFPDMYKIPVHFGSMEDCVNAAVTGRWTGTLK